MVQDNGNTTIASVERGEEETNLIEGKYAVDTILQTGEALTKRRSAETSIISKKKEDTFPKFSFSELTVGDVLGRGFYCVVNEITEVKLAPTEERSALQLEDEETILTFVHDRAFMEAHCRRKDDCRYALKRLQRVTRERSAEDYLNGLVDLAYEASLLAVIRHPNIVKMRAMGVHGPFSSRENFFLVLDRLFDTLTVRIAKWKERRANIVNQRSRKDFWKERIMVAHDIGSAVAYLHEKKYVNADGLPYTKTSSRDLFLALNESIIYRDLKPDNIGFDVRGHVKIFDFGLSRGFDPKRQDHNGQYRFTANTGSPRYMAPEVAHGKPYNERVDVYSFSLLLWHMIKLELPFGHISLPQLEKRVYRESMRPNCEGVPGFISNFLLKRGWGEPTKRPPMTQFVDVLEEQAGSFPEEQAAGVSASFLSAVQLGYRGASDGDHTTDSSTYHSSDMEFDPSTDVSIYQPSQSTISLDQAYQEWSSSDGGGAKSPTANRARRATDRSIHDAQKKMPANKKMWDAAPRDPDGHYGFLSTPEMHSSDAPSLHLFEM